jgi:hypothetical protein
MLRNLIDLLTTAGESIYWTGFRDGFFLAALLSLFLLVILPRRNKDE